MGRKSVSVALSLEQKNYNRKRMWIQAKKHKVLYLFMLPCIIWLLVFCYAPMAGIILAFKAIGLT